MMLFLPPPHVDVCSCSDSGQNGLRRLCIGTTAAPCYCNGRAHCKVSANKMCVRAYSSFLHEVWWIESGRLSGYLLVLVYCLGTWELGGWKGLADK